MSLRASIGAPLKATRYGSSFLPLAGGDKTVVLSIHRDLPCASFSEWASTVLLNTSLATPLIVRSYCISVSCRALGIV